MIFLGILGKVALADAYGSMERFEVPLYYSTANGFMLCSSEIDPESIFTDYHYRSSIGVPIEQIHEIRGFGLAQVPSPNYVLEIASNDGYLLNEYKALGHRVLGVDPATNLAEYAPGIQTIPEFFNESTAKEIVKRHGQADLIHAHNVLAHTPFPEAILGGVEIALSPNGAFICEVQYLIDTIESYQFENVYHEHYFYYSANALYIHFLSFGLMPVQVIRTPYQGGSLRVVCRKNQDAPLATVWEFLEAEKIKTEQPEFYKGFLSRTQESIKWLAEYLEKRPSAGFGASAKSTVMLNLAGLDKRHVPVIYDDADTKQGKTLPGTDIPILPTSEMLVDQPIILFAWNLYDRIVSKFPNHRFINVRAILTGKLIA